MEQAHDNSKKGRPLVNVCTRGKKLFRLKDIDRVPECCPLLDDTKDRMDITLHKINKGLI